MQSHRLPGVARQHGSSEQDQAAIKGAINKKHQLDCKNEADNVIRDLPPKQQRCAQAAQEKGTSSWLSALPIKSFGFALRKGAFKDAVAIRYCWPLHLTPFRCRRGVPFDIDHVMSCRRGGFHSLRRRNACEHLTRISFSEV